MQFRQTPYNGAMTFTAKIDLKLAPKLMEDLKSQGFEISKAPYAVFSAKKKGISCTLYESGKLTVQGKEKEPFIEFYLEPEILQDFRHSHPEAHLNLEPRIGMDEAGKGDFFGPLCVAAIYADEVGIKKMLQMKVRDSKRISDEGILKLAASLKREFPYTVIRLFPKKYNELYRKFKNLNRLLAWAHTAALTDLMQKSGCKKAILDQFAEKSLMEGMLKQKKIEVDLEQRVRGEEDLVVASASILARCAFLDGLKVLGEEHGVELPKGAAEGVKKVARTLIAQSGPEVLEKVAKIHFKTAGEL